MTSTLTIAQRHKIYKQIEGILEEGTHRNFPWICNTIEGLGFHVVDFPEFLSKRPEKDDDGFEVGSHSAWFRESNVKSRLKLIRECIKETAPKKRK